MSGGLAAAETDSSRRGRHMSSGDATFDHAHAVAAILAAYHEAEMAKRRETTSRALEQLQDGRKRTG